MRFSLLFPSLFVLSALLASCSSSDVASNGLFQKRKYNKGVHIDGLRKHANSTEVIAQIGDSDNENIAPKQNDFQAQKNLFRPLESGNIKSLASERKERKSEVVEATDEKIKRAIGLADSPLEPAIEDPDLIYWETSPPAVAIIGFITSMIGFIVAGIMLGVLSIVLGAIGVALIEKSEKKRKGKFFAIFAIIMGFVDILGALIVLGTIL